MKLHILGCNGPYPTPRGACSGYLVTSGDTKIELDLGTGTLAALTGLTAPEDLDALVFSHWHFDHCSDVLPLVYRMADAVAAGKKPLTVWGPADENSPVRAVVASVPCFTLKTIVAGDTVTIGGIRLTAYTARHPVPALMYRLTDGEKTLCYTGDTNTVDGLTDFAKDADLLLADGLFPVKAWAEGKPHLSALQTAELARDAGAKQLIITHLNPNFPAETLLTEARTAYLRARIAECGMTAEL